MAYQRSYERRLNAAVVGLGSHSYRNILPTMHYLPVKLRAVCDVNRALAEQTAAEYGCRAYASSAEMYQREALDAVFLCVGPDQHPTLCLEALAANLHVWIEKPPARSARQIEEMITRRGQKVVLVGFKKAFSPAARKVKSLCDQAGPARVIQASYPVALPPEGARADFAAGAPSNWLLNGVHPLSFLVYMGGAVRSVCAQVDADGCGCLTLCYESGAIGSLALCPGLMPSRERYAVYAQGWQAEIEGAKVSVYRGIPFEYDRTFDYLPDGLQWGTQVWDVSNCLATLENKALFTQGIYQEAYEFCDCVLNGRAPENGSLEMALEVMRVYEAALRSRGETAPVRV